MSIPIKPHSVRSPSPLVARTFVTSMLFSLDWTEEIPLCLDSVFSTPFRDFGGIHGRFTFSIAFPPLAAYWVKLSMAMPTRFRYST